MTKITAAKLAPMATNPAKVAAKTPAIATVDP
jgi:hypothetical protein